MNLRRIKPRGPKPDFAPALRKQQISKSAAKKLEELWRQGKIHSFRIGRILQVEVPSRELDELLERVSSGDLRLGDFYRIVIKRSDPRLRKVSAQEIARQRASAEATHVREITLYLMAMSKEGFGRELEIEIKKGLVTLGAARILMSRKMSRLGIDMPLGTFNTATATEAGLLNFLRKTFG